MLLQSTSAKKYIDKHNVDYIKMIKMDVDYHILSEERDNAIDMFAMFSNN